MDFKQKKKEKKIQLWIKIFKFPFLYFFNQQLNMTISMAVACFVKKIDKNKL